MTTDRIATLEIVIDGTKYYYEAHSHQRCAEILANQMAILETGETDDYGQPKYSHHLDSFTIHYFQE